MRLLMDKFFVFINSVLKFDKYERFGRMIRNKILARS